MSEEDPGELSESKGTHSEETEEVSLCELFILTSHVSYLSSYEYGGNIKAAYCLKELTHATSKIQNMFV